MGNTDSYPKLEDLPREYQDIVNTVTANKKKLDSVDVNNNQDLAYLSMRVSKLEAEIEQLKKEKEVPTNAPLDFPQETSFIQMHPTSTSCTEDIEDTEDEFDEYVPQSILSSIDKETITLPSRSDLVVMCFSFAPYFRVYMVDYEGVVIYDEKAKGKTLKEIEKNVKDLVKEKKIFGFGYNLWKGLKTLKLDHPLDLVREPTANSKELIKKALIEPIEDFANTMLRIYKDKKANIEKPANLFNTFDDKPTELRILMPSYIAPTLGQASCRLSTDIDIEIFCGKTFTESLLYLYGNDLHSICLALEEILQLVKYSESVLKIIVPNESIKKSEIDPEVGRIKGRIKIGQPLPKSKEKVVQISGDMAAMVIGARSIMEIMMIKKWTYGGPGAMYHLKNHDPASLKANFGWGKVTSADVQQE